MDNYPCIAFIGAGNMGSSLIGGLIANHYPIDKVWASNSDSDKLEQLQNRFNIHTTRNNIEACRHAQVVIIAVKPNVLKNVIQELKGILATTKPLIISIVAGVHAQTIAKWAGCDLSIVRCMPNTPALLGCGITGLYATPLVSEHQRTLAESILRAVGVCLWLEKEDEIDVVTAISGSGPAYFFLIMEAMQESAKQMGLNQPQAELLTVNTALGAARMALESDKDVATLRKQVTSPGGTTEQAIKVLEAGGIRDLFHKALTAAKDRAVDMSKLLD